MLIFKTTYDLHQLNPEHPFNPIIREHLSRTGHLEGYLVLIEEGDTSIDLPELKSRPANIQWEGVSRLHGFYHAVYLTNNEFALEFIIPDADWLDVELKESLDAHATY